MVSVGNERVSMEFAKAADMEAKPEGRRTGRSRINLGGDDIRKAEIGAVFEASCRAETLGKSDCL
jgi:hypothetical protein